MRHFGLCLVLALASPACADDWFTTKIEPVLREHCYPCHSHAAGKMKGGLTLDARSGWAEGGDSGAAIVPGRPQDSLLLSALRHESLEMPPEQKLPDEVIANFATWIARGAADPRVVDRSLAADTWWSLQPLAKPEFPSASGDGPRHPIDRFVEAKLAEHGLCLSPEADRRTLIRRLTIDLLGLPPTVEETRAFEADAGPDAYQRLIERLLASPRYGERWARHWMDTIHFADSHGFEHDIGRDNAWRFRDYLIDALNGDTPWPRFIREQLAADVFYPDQPPLMAALGFLGAGTFDLSTFSTAPVSFAYLDRDDLVTQTTSAFVSATANCARCHDHKFDPISQEDYYALQAVFSGLLKGDISYDERASVRRARLHWQALLTAAEQREVAVVLAPEHQPLVDAWLAKQAQGVRWQPLELETFLSTAGATLTRQAEGYVLASGPTPDRDTYVVSARSTLPNITALRVDLLSHDTLPMRGPGRCQNGNLHLSEIELQAFLPGAAAAQRIPLCRATADFNQTGWEIARAVDGDAATAWGIHPAVGQSHHAVFELTQPLSLPENSRLVVSLKQLHGGGHVLGAFNLAVTDAAAAEAAAKPAEVESALAVVAAQRTELQRTAIAAYVLQQAATAALAQLPERVRVYAAGPQVEVPTGDGKFAAHALAEPQQVHLLLRGDFDKPQALVEPGALTALTHLPARFELDATQGESLRRAALADWIAHRDNVLTWRSVVNRVWQHHFGGGLCDTPSDFGRMGDPPSHPELIDWLAVWFRDDAQASLKQLHRLIVTSASYRQASQQRVEALAIDGENRLYWRQNRRRLDADSFRDATLAASGGLELSMGGPAVQHFKQSQGPQSTPALDYSDYDWSQPAAGRRSIYRFVWRGIADPFMEALDFPDLGLLSPKRSYSDSSLQALALYNNDFVLHHSRELARHSASNASDSTAAPASPAALASIDALVNLVWLRPPNCHERQLFEKFAAQHGLPALARVLLNSNEFLFVD